MPPKKPTGTKALVGKPIMMKSRYEENPDGPFIFLGIEDGFLRIYNPEKNREFWFNARLVDSFTEVKGEK